MNDTPTRQRCAACHQICSVGFWVPDEMWKAVIHPQFVNSPLCLACFVSRADEKVVAWDKVIELYPASLCSHLKRHHGLVSGADLGPLICESCGRETLSPTDCPHCDSDNEKGVADHA